MKLQAKKPENSDVPNVCIQGTRYYGDYDSNVCIWAHIFWVRPNERFNFQEPRNQIEIQIKQ